MALLFSDTRRARKLKNPCAAISAQAEALSEVLLGCPGVHPCRLRPAVAQSMVQGELWHLSATWMSGKTWELDVSHASTIGELRRRIMLASGSLRKVVLMVGSTCIEGPAVLEVEIKIENKLPPRSGPKSSHNYRFLRKVTVRTLPRTPRREGGQEQIKKRP